MGRQLNISFVLIGEGETERGLRAHLEQLCVEGGADEARGVVPDFGRLKYDRALRNRLRAARELEPAANLYFIHHDADDEAPDQAYEVIRNAVAASQHGVPYVALVPIQETEAWLLGDEQAIRKAAGRPGGRAPLNLPPLQRIEATARPKERLHAALIAASELSGRRLERFKREFGIQRQILLERLPLGGPLERLDGWCRLRDDTAAAITALRAAQEALP